MSPTPSSLPSPALHPTRRSAWQLAPFPLDGQSCVREWPGRYEDEGSERLSRGAVSVARNGWWSATLSVPIRSELRDDPPVMLRLVRLGEGAEPAGSPELAVQLSMLELDAVVALLGGVVAQARRDGVLPPA